MREPLPQHKAPEFTQIVAGQHDKLYALDRHGRVWLKFGSDPWRLVNADSRDRP